jgi:hypothetical protein
MTLGLLAAAVHAQEVEWHAASPRPQPQLPAAALALPRSCDTPTGSEAATLSAPRLARCLSHVPRADQAIDGGVVPVSAARPVNPGPKDDVTWTSVRAQNGDDDAPRPPVGLPAPTQPITTLPVMPLPATPTVEPTPGSPVTPDSKVVMATPATVYPGGTQVYLLGENPFGEAAPSSPPRLEAYAEYLLWWTRSTQLPPLVTTAPFPAFGFLNAPGTTLLFGGDSAGNDFRQGGRFGGVFWLDDCREFGIDGNVFFTGRRTNSFTADSMTFPVIARPFVPLNPGFPPEFVELTAYPGIGTGNINVSDRSLFWGADTNFRTNLCCGCNYRVDLLAGFRYLDLDEDLTIVENISEQAGSSLGAGAQRRVFDRFATRNDFYGGQLGAVTHYHRDRWTFDLKTSIALGNTHERLDIEGNQFIRFPNGTTRTDVGGLLALRTNIGSYTHDAFAAVPEVGLNVGYQVTERLKAYVGYNFLYWSNVIRPGDQIDRGININNIPNVGMTAPQPTDPANVNRPAPLFKETDFWAQGVTFGLEYRW